MKKSKRVSIKHFKDIKPIDFINVINNWQHVKFKEKFDGFNMHFGIDEESKFFIESSKSGPIYNFGTFSKYTRKISGNSLRALAYDGVLKTLLAYERLQNYLLNHFPEGIKIHCECLCTPLGTYIPSANNKYDMTKFVNTWYESNKLARFATFIIYGLKTVDGQKIRNKELIEGTIFNLSLLSNNQIKFTDDKIEMSKINIIQERENLLSYIRHLGIDYNILLKSRKIELHDKKESLLQVIYECQKTVSEKILQAVKHGKLGTDFEAVILEYYDDMFKIKKGE